MKLSIVSTMYYSDKYILEFYNRVKNAAEKITNDYEIILVNDGSPDSSLEVALSIRKNDQKVQIIDLSRNFGHHKAMMEGLSFATGDFVFLIDCDLEEQPEWLNDFYPLLSSKNCDVVYGVQGKRKGNYFEQFTGYIYYKFIKICAGFNLAENLVTARLMTKRYVKSLLQFKETEVWIAGLWHVTGYRQEAITIKKLSREGSSYSLAKKISVLANSLTSFSNRPLKGIFYFGTGTLLFSFLVIAYLLFRWLFFGIAVGGWVSIMISIWFFSGIMIFFMGIIGIYLSKVCIEVKSRPRTIVRTIYKT